MQRIKALMRIKICLLLAAIVLAFTLVILPSPQTPREETTVIIIDMHAEMLQQDITTTQSGLITRLDAAKQIIIQLVQTFPKRAFGLVTYGDEIDYLIPPTLDYGNLLQYVDGLIVSQDGELKIENGGLPIWGTGLLDALKDKQLLIIGDIVLPQVLASYAKNLGLGSQIHSLSTIDTIIKDYNVSISQPLNLSIGQATWLIVLLCILAALAL